MWMSNALSSLDTDNNPSEEHMLLISFLHGSLAIRFAFADSEPVSTSESWPVELRVSFLADST